MRLEDEHPDPLVRSLTRQVRSLREDAQRLGELVDVLASPPWKRAWFFVQGYRLWRVGRWYRAPWNSNGMSDGD